MTRTQTLLYRRRALLWIAAALLALGGGLALAFLQINRAEGRATELATEADRRGDAVSTLAGDVRTLRAQIKANGETPAVPDPAQAVDDLPARAEVPVPIPGPPGPRGQKGESGVPGEDGQDGRPGADGSPGPAVTGVPGRDGTNGADGAQGAQGVQGERGEKGEKGDVGATGPAGPAGPSCPDGYTLQPPPGDPDALVCRRTGAPPAPEDPASTPSPLALALDPTRRQYP
ncbi:collagen-like domain-containing protein [Streptomyces anulatus]|uniref:collagen-like protein n=1 Tax=Streptomyces anulatus TaxID=1892 RepID=UPI0036847387